MSKEPDQDALEELIGPVCMIAELRPTNEWSVEWRQLIGAARSIKKRYGFEVVTMKLAD